VRFLMNKKQRAGVSHGFLKRQETEGWRFLTTHEKKRSQRLLTPPENRAVASSGTKNDNNIFGKDGFPSGASSKISPNSWPNHPCYQISK